MKPKKKAKKNDKLSVLKRFRVGTRVRLNGRLFQGTGKVTKTTSSWADKPYLPWKQTQPFPQLTLKLSAGPNKGTRVMLNGRDLKAGKLSVIRKKK